MPPMGSTPVSCSNKDPLRQTEGVFVGGKRENEVRAFSETGGQGYGLVPLFRRRREHKERSDEVLPFSIFPLQNALPTFVGGAFWRETGIEGGGEDEPRRSTARRGRRFAGPCPQT